MKKLIEKITKKAALKALEEKLIEKEFFIENRDRSIKKLLEENRLQKSHHEEQLKLELDKSKQKLENLKNSLESKNANLKEDSLLLKKRLELEKKQELERASDEHKALKIKTDKIIHELRTELKLRKDTTEQDKVMIEDLRKQVNRLYEEHGTLIATRERLSAQLKALNICIMAKKDVIGRAFSRIAPLINEEGYDLLKSKTGRMKLKLMHPDGEKLVVFVEMENA